MSWLAQNRMCSQMALRMLSYDYADYLRYHYVTTRLVAPILGYCYDD
jgi:hypothetical protein